MAVAGSGSCERLVGDDYPGTASLVCPGTMAQTRARSPGCVRTLLCAPTLHTHAAELCTGVLLSQALSSPAPPQFSPPPLPSLQPSRAAQSGLAPQQCLPQGAAELWALSPQPHPHGRHSSCWGAERGLSTCSLLHSKMWEKIGKPKEKKKKK